MYFSQIYIISTIHSVVVHHVFIFCIEGQEGDIYLGQNRGFPLSLIEGNTLQSTSPLKQLGGFQPNLYYIYNTQCSCASLFIFCIEGLKGDIYLGQNRGFPHFTDRGQHPTIHISSETTGWISAKFILYLQYTV